nr:type II secretion system protein [uncultured Anaerosporobacter sp.]
MCKEKEENKGFTLVELLVCVAILAIISVPLLNSFFVAGKTNEKAKEIQRTTTLAQNIMETVKGQNLSQLKILFGSSNLIGLNLNAPYDITNSFAEVKSEDLVNGRYEYCIKRVKDGIGEYDVYITLNSALYKTESDAVQNKYQMPKITNLTGDKIAVIDPEAYSASWNSYVDASGETIYSKDTSTNMDNMIITYFYNLHMAYLDYLTMQNQAVADAMNADRVANGLPANVVANPLPSYYPYSYNQIKGFITKETSIVATNGIKLDGSYDTSVVNLTSKISYSIPGTDKVTGDVSGLHTEYQVFSKTFKTSDGTNPLEQIYLFYNRSDFPEDVVVIKNSSINEAELNIVDQLTGVVKVKCNDPANTWKLASNASITLLEGSKVIDTELVSSEDPVDRLFEVKVEVYQTDSGIRTGKKYSELLSTKGE